MQKISGRSGRTNKPTGTHLNKISLNKYSVLTIQILQPHFSSGIIRLKTNKMKLQVLLPTDFSAVSLNAIFYAADFAQHIPCDITLLHVLYFDGPPPATGNAQELEEELQEHAKREMVHILEDIQQKYPDNTTSVNYKIISSYPVEEGIEEETRQQPYDLIMMGSKGSTGLKKIILGSNAIAVLRNCSLPVCIIPEYARFQGLEKLVYASDITNLHSELSGLLPFAQYWNAEIKVLHVIPDNSTYKGSTQAAADHVVDEIIAQSGYKNIDVHILESDAIAHGIVTYAANIKADMVALYVPKKSRWKQFISGDITRDLAAECMLPLIIFPK